MWYCVSRALFTLWLAVWWDAYLRLWKQPLPIVTWPISWRKYGPHFGLLQTLTSNKWDFTQKLCSTCRALKVHLKRERKLFSRCAADSSSLPLVRSRGTEHKVRASYTYMTSSGSTADREARSTQSVHLTLIWLAQARQQKIWKN